MSDKIIALAFSDLHLHPFQAFSKTKYERLDKSLEVSALIASRAKKLEVPVLFAGDLLHDPKEIGNTVLKRIIKHFKTHYEKPKVPFVGISGNHDFIEVNSTTHQSDSYLHTLAEAFKMVTCLDEPLRSWVNGELAIAGVPYMNDEKEYLKAIKQENDTTLVGHALEARILLLHRDLPGCPNPQGYIVEDTHFPEKFDKLWSNARFVLSGHIHKPWQASTKSWMLGSPIHQNAGDEGCDMGYWEIWREKGMVFKSLQKKFPNFVTLKIGQDPWNEKDYFIPAEEPEEEGDESESTGFSNKASSIKLVKKYLKVKGIKSKPKKQLLTEILNEAKNL